MKSLAIATFVLILFGAAKNVEACTCSIPLGSLETKVRKAKSDYSAIFVGKLTKLEEPKTKDGKLTGEVIAHFEVERVWKGGEKAEVTVYTTTVCCACGYSFSEGVRYIVYAHGSSDKLFVSSCSRTAPMSAEASEDERYLGTPRVVEKKKKYLEPAY